MDFKKVVSEIQTLPLFEQVMWAKQKVDTQFGCIDVPTRTFKDSGKNEYMLGGTYNIFIAHVYQGQAKDFIYVTIERPSRRRNYRCSQSYRIDWNKRYASGNTIEKLMTNLKKELKGYELL